MKKITLFLIIMFVAVAFSTAQKSVALHSNGTTTIFGGDTPLTQAYTAAITGDTLYVSGGTFSLPVAFNKGLVIIGAGYHPEYTDTTQKTYIYNPGGITLGHDASNTYLEGLEFSHSLGVSTGVITNFTIIRCKFNAALSCTGPSIPTYATITQCDISGVLQLNGVANSLISNCIIRNRLTYSSNNTIKNNIFTMVSGSVVLDYSDTNIFWNNIFSYNGGAIISNSTNNNFQYNIFPLANQSLGSSPTDLNNYKAIDLSTVYVNASEGDYHLLPDASTTYLGDDGTEVGLFGGVLPFKEGAIPINPHISQKSIQTTTDSNGLLNISFTVEAQQN